MSERSYERRPEEIEDEIARTRADMDSTLDALQRKLSPDELMDRAMNYVRRNGVGDLMRSAGATVRENPIPVALIGLGAAWLLVDAVRSRGRDESRPGEGYAYENHPEERYVYGEHAGLGQGAHGTAYGEANGPAADEAASWESHRRFGAVRQRGRKVAELARQRVDSARESYEHAVSDQPLSLGVASLIVGAAIGLMLPSSRREDQALGEYRDQLLAQAQEAGREQVEKAQRVANETWQAAKERAKDAAAEEGIVGGTEAESASAAQPQTPTEERGASPLA